MSSDAFEGVGTGLWIVDAHGRTEFANHALRTLLGNRELAGERALGFFVEAEQDTVEERFAQLALGATQKFDAQLQTAAGEAVSVHVCASPRFDGDGALLGSVCEVRLAGHASADAAASGRAYLASYLTAGVVHTLNTYLQAVVGYSDLLDDDERLPAELKDPVRRLRHSGSSAARLVANLVSLSEVDDDPSPGPVDLVPLIEEALASRDTYLVANHVRVHRDYPPESVYVNGTLPSLRRAVAHLISSTCQVLLGHRAARMRVSIVGGEREVTLRIVTEGARCPDELLAPQASGAASPLQVTHQMAVDALARGGARVEISNDGDAGVLRVVLPRDHLDDARAYGSAPVAVVRRTIEDVENSQPLRVLVVDDEEFILDLSRRALKGRCALTTAQNGDEALSLLKARTFDLVITDLRMPGSVDGMGLYEWARSHAPGVAGRMVFTTADTVNATSREFLMLAGRPFITKPYKMQQYRAFILDELRRAAAA